MLFDMTFDEPILIWVGSDFTTSLKVVLDIGTGEKSCCEWRSFSYLWCCCLWCNLVTKSKNSWCIRVFGAVTTFSPSITEKIEVRMDHAASEVLFAKPMEFQGTFLSVK